jgi:hypothetical protein
MNPPPPPPGFNGPQRDDRNPAGNPPYRYRRHFGPGFSDNFEPGDDGAAGPQGESAPEFQPGEPAPEFQPGEPAPRDFGISEPPSDFGGKELPAGPGDVI